jgi:DNA-binding beta-propeller fold protein YncE
MGMGAFAVVGRGVVTARGALSAPAVRLAAIALFVGVGLVLASVVPALATTGHRYASQFSGPGFAPGEVISPSGLAIRQSTGDVYVLDPGSVRVERFDAAGEFLSSFDGSGTPTSAFGFPSAIAIDQSSGHVYVADAANNAVDVFSAAGAYLSQLDATATPATAFASPSGVAVDPTNGKVYVSDTADNVVDVFDNTGAFITSFDGSGAGDGPFVAPTGIAVDAGHNVYVLDSGKARVEKYTAQGAAFTSIFDSTSPVAVAADPSSGDVYVAENGPSGVQVSDFDSSGDPPFTFAPPHIGATVGLDVNASTGAVYVADLANCVVERFTAFTLPTLTTEGASGVSATQATVAGTINPEGVAGTTTYRFDYGPSTSYGASSEPVDTGGGSSDVPAGAVLTGLQPGTTYHYRLVGTNASGSIVGADETFTTSPAQASARTGDALAITPTTASLNAMVNPNGADTTYHFEYGTSSGYGTSTPDADAGTAAGETPVTAPITGLQPGTTYHYRVVADNGITGPVQGADAEFTTAPGTPPNASEVTANSATLNATVIPVAIPETGSSYHFEYGTDTSYGKSTIETKLPPSANEELVSIPIASLAPGTTYHFRVVMTIANSERVITSVTSSDATFATIPAASVATMPATEVTSSTATLNATVDTHGSAGTVAFAVTSPDSAYATTASSTAVAATSGPQSVSVVLTGILPGAKYLVRAAATVAGVTEWGNTVEFSSPQRPPFPSPPAPPAISSDPYGGLVVPQEPSEPSNAFTVTKVSVRGTTARVSVRVPGPGKLQSASSGSARTSTVVSKASTTTIVVKLSRAARRALAKARKKRLTIAVRVSFTPTGGTAATKTQSITFKRGGTR